MSRFSNSVNVFLLKVNFISSSVSYFELNAWVIRQAMATPLCRLCIEASLSSARLPQVLKIKNDFFLNVR